MKVKKPINKKTRQIIIKVIIALISYGVGVVTKQNPEVGKIIKDVIEITSPILTVDNNKNDSTKWENQ